MKMHFKCTNTHTQTHTC